MLNLSRLSFTPGEKTFTYLPKAGHGGEQGQTFDAMDFLARIPVHVPDPRRHLIFYYGYYSNVARGKRKALENAEAQQPEAPESDSAHVQPSLKTSPGTAALRRS